ncbi:Reverse transcriptase domain [Cinara cedri]|uniref:Reverse transcriptase domain n=1 Tax=Cinara cedri TaxID=506608 RepID=A0A5E4N285_9HEMI|nr:Reverse transcriptase domain [Cinara cedri]
MKKSERLNKDSIRISFGKSLRTIWLGDPTNKDKEEQYKRYQKEAHNTLRRENRLYAQKLLEAEKDFRINNIRQLYQKINTTRGGYKKRERFLREDDGTLVTEQGKLLEKWTGYFEKLLNAQIKRLKNHKSPGEDGIQAEILKRVDEEAISRIHEVIELIWEKERLPEDWNTSIKPLSEGVLGGNQGGFRPNRSTTDQIFCIRQIAQKSWEYNKELYILFIDFEKAYDSIHRPTLINILKEFNFPIKLVNLIKASLENTLIKIKIANAVSETVRVSTSLTQGNALSPVLFNLVLEKIVRGLNTIDGVAMGNTTIDLLAYADGLAFLGNNLDTVKQNCRKLINVAGKRGLKINDKKTKNVIIGRRSRKYQQGEFMEIDNHKFKRASHFKYLGSIITQDSHKKISTLRWRWTLGF